MSRNFCILVIVSLCYVTNTFAGDCPHEDSSLQLWSKGGFAAQSDVVLKKDRFLLDISVEVNSITIEAGSALVFADRNLTVKTRYILVKGELTLGSEKCKLTNNIRISLFGDKGDVSVDGFGEKFIGVSSGGTLEIHGEERLSWTKLTKTVRKFADGMLSDQWNFNATNHHEKVYKGLVLYVWDSVTGQLEYAGQGFAAGRRTVSWVGNQCEADQEAREFKQKIDDVPDGKIVGVALKNELIMRSDADLALFYEILERFAFGDVTKKSKVRDLRLHDAYALITKKGDTSKTQEILAKDDKKDDERAAEVSHYENGIKFTARSWVHTIRRSACYSRAKSAVAEIADPKLELVDDVQTWKSGDQVVLLSTDYDWRQAEIATVTDCSDCSEYQARIDLEAKFTHFGEVYKNVDMRGEVGLLTRNIVIEGLPAKKSTTLGGHIKILHGFKSVHVENVQLSKMGQTDSIGNYPFHFHMCEDVDKTPGVAPPYLRGSSIHNSFARCVTIHGTHGAVVENNFCFKSVGHGYFLEDGGEKRTVLRGNLGAGQTRTTRLTKSDKAPTTFWITNPQTILKDNVAAGSDSAGIWYIFPDEPIFVSKDKGFMAKYEARHTVLSECDNNVAHSNKFTGFVFDSRVRSDGDLQFGSYYEPWVDPLDKTSGPSKSVISRLTAYKNEEHNAWIDGSDIEVRKSSFSDSLLSLTFDRSTEKQSYVKESVFLGESINLGDPSRVINGRVIRQYPRSVPLRFADHPRHGFAFYNRPSHAEDCYFGDFTNTATYEAGAFGFQRNKNHVSALLASAKGILFGFEDPKDGDRVLETNVTQAGFLDNDGDIASFTDIDGSVSGLAGSRIVKPLPFHMTAKCKEVTNWKMAYCPHQYGQIRTRFRASLTAKLIVTRDDEVDNPIYADRFGDAPFQVILGGSHSYIVHTDLKEATKEFVFEAVGLTKKNYVRIGVCIPRDATSYSVSVYEPSLGAWRRGILVDSLSKVDSATTMRHYFIDKDVGVVFVKIMHSREKRATDTGKCLDDKCPKVVVRSFGGNRKDEDCTGRAYPKYKRTPIKSTDKDDAVPNFPITSVNPPAAWGAGITRTRK